MRPATQREIERFNQQVLRGQPMQKLLKLREAGDGQVSQDVYKEQIRTQTALLGLAVIPEGNTWKLYSIL